MHLTFDTNNVEASIALRALDNYRAGRFNETIADLLNILDVEPRNWQGRLMLGACYFKTSQFASAERAFRNVWENCQEAELRERALIALQVTQDKLHKKSASYQMPVPAEFGACAPRIEQSEPKTWLNDTTWH